MPTMKYLIAGLGNIGPEYHETRHNIGFMTVDALAAKTGATFADGRYGFTARLMLKGRQIVLLKPSTYMNLSGNAVRYWLQKENIPLENGTWKYFWSIIATISVPPVVALLRTTVPLPMPISTPPMMTVRMR